jgi:hypothetical protein
VRVMRSPCCPWIIFASVTSLNFTLAHMDMDMDMDMEMPLPSLPSPPLSLSCSDGCTHCPRDQALPGNMSLLLHHHRASKSLARWWHEAKCRQRIAQRRSPTKAPVIGLCIASTSNGASQHTWAEKLEHAMSYSQVVVVSTISRDISNVIQSLRLAPTLGDASSGCLRKLSFPHLLLEGEEWRCRIRVDEDARRNMTAFAKELVVRRMAHPSGMSFTPSVVWGTPESMQKAHGLHALTLSEARWADLELAMQGGCLTAIEGFEARMRPRVDHFQIDMIVVFRVDFVWLPKFTPSHLMAPAWAHFGCAQTPTVLLPDVGDGAYGYNDRMAIMNRAAGPAYLRRSWLLSHPQHFVAHQSTNEAPSVQSKLLAKPHRPHQIFARSSEQVLLAALRMEGVTVHRFPNVAATSCCSKKRTTCRMPVCYATCSRPRKDVSTNESLPLNESTPPSYQASLFSRILVESLLTTIYEDALASGRSRLASNTGCGTHVELPCDGVAPWSRHSLRRPHTYAVCVHPRPIHRAFQKLTQVSKDHVKRTTSRYKANQSMRTDASVPHAKCNCSFGTLQIEREESMSGKCMLRDHRHAAKNNTTSGQLNLSNCTQRPGSQ